MSKKDYIVQSVLISDKNSIDDAIKWLLRNKYKLTKVDKPDNYYRFRQISPKTVEKRGFSEYRTITIDKDRDIKLILVYKPSVISGGLLIQKSKYL
jgi:hypothetical protein